jgi:predicted DNA-binding ribbon-helix-helix protein
MHLSSLYVTKPQWTALKRLARRKGLTASELVRRIADRYLERAA